MKHLFLNPPPSLTSKKMNTSLIDENFYNSNYFLEKIFEKNLASHILSNISDTNKNILNQLANTLYNNRHIQKKLQIINKYQQKLTSEEKICYITKKLSSIISAIISAKKGDLYLNNKSNTFNATYSNFKNIVNTNKKIKLNNLSKPQQIQLMYSPYYSYNMSIQKACTFRPINGKNATYQSTEINCFGAFQRKQLLAIYTDLSFLVNPADPTRKTITNTMYLTHFLQNTEYSKNIFSR